MKLEITNELLQQYIDVKENITHLRHLLQSYSTNLEQFKEYNETIEFEKNFLTESQILEYKELMNDCASNCAYILQEIMQELINISNGELCEDVKRLMQLNEKHRGNTFESYTELLNLID